MRRFANRQRVGKWQQRHSATGRYWQFFRRPLKFAFRFASITITVADSEGNLKEAAVIETSHVTKNPQRESASLWIAPPRNLTNSRSRMGADVPANHRFLRFFTAD